MEEKIKLQYANLCGRGNVWRHEIMFTKTGHIPAVKVAAYGSDHNRWRTKNRYL